MAAIKKAGGKAEYLHHDVTDEAAWAGVIAEVKTRHGRLDILVNNAGIGIGGSILEMTLADWRRQTAVNLDGVFLGVKHSIPLMRASGDGGIDRQHVVGGRPEGLGRPGRLLRHQGRRAAVHQGRRHGMRQRQGRHPGELGPPGHHRDADLARSSTTA